MESLQKSCVILKAALNLWNLHSCQQILQFLISSKRAWSNSSLSQISREGEWGVWIHISGSEQMGAGLTAAIPLFSILDAAKISHKLDFGKSRQRETPKHQWGPTLSDIFKLWENICGYNNTIQGNSNPILSLILNTKPETLVNTLQVN